jgi:triacylglycerol lipase
MLARLQRLIVLALVGLAAAWLIHWGSRGQLVWAGLGAWFIVSIQSPVLALEFVLMHIINRTDTAPRASFSAVLRAWWRESWTAAQVFGWRQPFRADAEPDDLSTRSHGHRAVVLVHGFVCNRAFWNPWMRRLRELGVPYVAINLEPVFCSIDRYPPLIDAAVRRAAEATGLAPLVVAHSMGGLAVRAWLQGYDADTRVSHVVTVGTPHQGTWLGRFGYALNAREMGLSGDWLGRLAARESTGRRSRFICFYSHCDNIVFPASAATLAGADNRHVPGAAHVDMINHGVVFEAVLDLAQSQAPPGHER